MRKAFTGCSFFLLGLLVGCQSNQSVFYQAYQQQVQDLNAQLLAINPDTAAIKIEPSANFNLRKPQFIVLHDTEQDSCQQTIDMFQKASSEVSAHYVICEDGRVVQMLSDYVRGWHAGEGQWFTLTDMNSLSLGIELDNNGQQPFSKVQIDALIELLMALTEKHAIPRDNVIGHADWAVGRKVDPSSFFPWAQLAKAGFGRWYDESLLDSTVVPVDFDSIQGLKNIGYKVESPEAALKSFRIHYLGVYKEEGEVTSQEAKIIYLLNQGV